MLYLMTAAEHRLYFSLPLHLSWQRYDWLMNIYFSHISVYIVPITVVLFQTAPLAYMGRKKRTPKPIFRGKRSLKNTSLLDKLITS